MVTALLNTISSWITGFTTMFVNIFEGIVPIFYTAGEGSTPGQITLVGTLALAGLGISLVYFGYKVIRKLMRLHG